MPIYDVMFPDEHRPRRINLLVQLCVYPDLHHMERFVGCRIRDAWTEMHGDEMLIRVITRIGGGNRPDYAEKIKVLQSFPSYVRDEDEPSDSTYASFYYSLPSSPTASKEEVMESFRHITAPEPIDFGLLFEMRMKQLQEADELPPHMLAIADQIAAAIKDPGDGPKIIEI